MLAAIGGITMGMSEKGQLKGYLDKLTSKFEVSSASREMLQNLERAVEIYRSLDSSENKSFTAFEVVETTARTINGLLLENITSLLEGDKKDRYQKLSQEYNVDSLGLARNHLTRLEVTLAKDQAGTKKLQPA